MHGPDNPAPTREAPKSFVSFPTCFINCGLFDPFLAYLPPVLIRHLQMRRSSGVPDAKAPFRARIAATRELCSGGDRSTRHVEFDISSSHITYSVRRGFALILTVGIWFWGGVN
jgi:hypothetical protein